MINWQRVFESIWMQIRWLKSYNQINELALKKILKKFIKNFFKIKDNTIKKKLEQIVESKEFNRKDSKSNRDLRILSEGLLQFYADMFCDGSQSTGRKVLNAQHNRIRTIDAVIIALFLGAIIVMFSFLVFFIVMPDYDPNGQPWSELSSGIETFIFCFVIVFIIISTAVNIQIFRQCQVNYTFIFEIDTNHKVIHH